MMGIRTAAQRAYRRGVLRGRRNLSAALASPSGVIDVASVIVGVIILAVLGTITAAALVNAVPWAQESEARTTLNNVRVAENASRIATGQYQSVANLISGGYLTKSKYSAAPDPNSGQLTNTGLPNPGVPVTTTGPGTFGTCYVAALRLNTGMVLWLSSSNATIQKINPASGAPDTSACAGFPYVANFPGPALQVKYNNQTFDLTSPTTPLAPTVTGGNGSQPTFTCTVSGAACTTGNMPSGVTFDSATGRFTGSTSWPMSATSVAGTNNTLCASMADLTARCWGEASFGQVGDGGTATGAARTVSTPSTVLTAIGTNLTGVKKVSGGVGILGGMYMCALLNTGGVSCWGYNTYRGLGDGTSTARSLAAPVKDGAGTLTGAIDIAAGGDHACALITGGTVKCWGYNNKGDVGDGTTTLRAVATPVSSLTGVVKVAAGDTNTCALTTAGAAYCWGAGSTAMNGDGTTSDRLVPTPVTGLSAGVADISMGTNNTCVLMTTATVKCWGGNSFKQLDNTGNTYSSPLDITQAGSSVAKVIVGYSDICAVSTTRALSCWGDNTGGQWGDNSTSGGSGATPHTPTGFSSGATLIATWKTGICGITSGALKCWGSPSKGGEIGDGTTTTTPTRWYPQQVAGITGVPGFPFSPVVTATDGQTVVGPINLALGVG